MGLEKQVQQLQHLIVLSQLIFYPEVITLHENFLNEEKGNRFLEGFGGCFLALNTVWMLFNRTLLCRIVVFNWRR